MFEDRGIYHVDLGKAEAYVLRAFRYDAAAALLDQAAALAYLRRHGYPAPRVLPTKDGAVLATYQGWTALLLSFIQGAMADFSPATLALLGMCAGSLHILSRNVILERDEAFLPNSRLHPSQISPPTLEQLSYELQNIPSAHLC
jgi:Ser/Thr protein kinase RdoA (MazF antagonist)